MIISKHLLSFLSVNALNNHGLKKKNGFGKFFLAFFLSQNHSYRKIRGSNV
tara:strand:+ start:53 stop:205 length:153 start_codon:yes stop_codon:yes gene_type:complete